MSVDGQTYDYYWRDFTGVIPEDAIEGGYDKNKVTTYIGQVYVHKFGVSTAVIYPGKSCAIPSVQNFEVWNYVKILCSRSKEKFQWISADAKTLHVEMVNKHLVPGGVEWNGKVTNIGRILYQDYYWREYTGTIPRDAVEGGRGPNNRATYIGQVSVREHGIIPVTIYPGNTSVVAPVYGVHHVNLYIKILCSSSRESLRWIQVDSEHFHVQTANRHLVRGGLEGELLSYIGRIRYQGETIVGKVRQHGVGNVILYFPDGEEEKNATSFEILVYDR